MTTYQTTEPWSSASFTAERLGGSEWFSHTAKVTQPAALCRLRSVAKTFRKRLFTMLTSFDHTEEFI